MNPNKALWEKGDFTRIADTMRQSGIDLVAKIGVTNGMKVLELGGGDGTTAIPAAKLGAEVLGVDIASNLVKAGNLRAKKEGLTNCVFTEGDACQLTGLKDQSFDMVVSIFGAMFAPRPDDATREMVRVTKPGGKIIMGNWIPGDPTLVAQLLKISSAYLPPPPEGFISPMAWGIEKNVVERFGKAGIPERNISFSKEPWSFHTPYPAVKFLDLFRDYFGPTMNAFEAAAKNGKAEELYGKLAVIFNKENKSASPDNTDITANYLLVTVLR